MKEKPREKMMNLVDKPLETAKGQYNMILEILRLKEENEENTEMIMKKYEKLEDFRIKYTKKEDMSVKMMVQCLKVSAKEILKEVRKILEKALKHPTTGHIGELQVSVF